MGFVGNAVSTPIGSNNGQVNISKDDFTIKATNVVKNKENDAEKISELANKFLRLLKNEDMDKEEKEMTIEDVEVIKEQISSDKPRLPRIKRTLQSLKGIETVLSNGTGVMLTLNELSEKIQSFIDKF